MEWMILPLKRYADFRGRSRRKEYWMFVLFNFIVGIVLGIVETLLGLRLGGVGGVGVLSGLYNLAIFIPSLAVGVRRLHDTDRTGWYLLLPVATGAIGGVLAGFIGSTGGPVVAGLLGGAIGASLGFLVLLVFYCLDGTSGPNRFGPDPKNPDGDLAEVFG